MRINYRALRDNIRTFLVLPLRTYCLSLFERKTISKISKLTEASGKKCLIFATDIHYFGSLQQRCMHLIKEFADNGFVCIWPDSHLAKMVDFSFNVYGVPASLLPVLLKSDIPYILDMYTTAYPSTAMGNIYKNLSPSTPVLLEHVDDFEIINNKKQRNKAIDVYRTLAARQSTVVVTTADRLKQQLLSLCTPEQNILVNKNAVRISDFTNFAPIIPKVLQSVLQKQKPIIGYYGTLSSRWFDFALCQELIQAHPEWEFVFIGKKSDTVSNALELNDNYTYISPVSYTELKYFAYHFNVAIIPFLVNEITLGTSPVKLFEYMALGLPIVTTKLPECTLYQSCMLAENALEFADCIRRGILLKQESAYQAVLQSEALQNTWESRAAAILNCLQTTASC